MSHWKDDVLIIPAAEFTPGPQPKTLSELKVEELEKVVEGLPKRLERLEMIMGPSERRSLF